MINEAIVLAGGFGTRLQKVINEVPKPMAPINNVPFLSYLLQKLKENNINKITLSVGYKSETIRSYFGDSYKGIPITYKYEIEPLGTGGGMKFASEEIESDFFFVLNGDTFFDINIQELGLQAKLTNSDVTVALKKMYEFDRYGSIKVNSHLKIIGFEEKKYQEIGFINGGIYCLKKNILSDKREKKFSFEKDILEKSYNHYKFYGKIFSDYFIDIGIPNDYFQAQNDFKKFEY